MLEKTLGLGWQDMSIRNALAYILAGVIVILLVFAGLSYSSNYSLNEPVDMPSDI